MLVVTFDIFLSLTLKMSENVVKSQCSENNIMQKLFYYLSTMLCFSSACYSALFFFSSCNALFYLLKCFVVLVLATMLYSCTYNNAFFFFFGPQCFLLLCATMLCSSSACHNTWFFVCLSQCFALLLATMLLALWLSSSCYNGLLLFLLEWFLFTAKMLSFFSPCYNAFFLLQCYLLATMLCCCSLCYSAFIFLLQCFVFLLQYFVLLLLVLLLLATMLPSLMIDHH